MNMNWGEEGREISFCVRSMRENRKYRIHMVGIVEEGGVGEERVMQLRVSGEKIGGESVWNREGSAVEWGRIIQMD